MKKTLSPRSPWHSGSFYLAVFLLILLTIACIGHMLAWFIMPIVLIGAILALLIVGVLQLRQDEKLSQENFIKLMGLSLKYIPWLWHQDKTP